MVGRVVLVELVQEDQIQEAEAEAERVILPVMEQ